MHHVSLERDKLRTDLSRTLEEKRKLVREGDEHVDLVTQITEDKIKYVCLFVLHVDLVATVQYNDWLFLLYCMLKCLQPGSKPFLRADQGDFQIVKIN